MSPTCFNAAIRKMTPAGTNWTVATIAGGSVGTANGTGTNAQFNLPFGLAADAFGDVFVADLGNNAVRLGSAANSPAPTGAVQVTLTPSGALTAGAEWQLDGGPLQTSGTTLASLVPGLHTLAFANVAGFTTPALQTIAVTAHQTNQLAANYSTAIANAGSLQVLLSPPGPLTPARPMAGRWRRVPDQHRRRRWLVRRFPHRFFQCRHRLGHARQSGRSPLPTAKPPWRRQTMFYK